MSAPEGKADLPREPGHFRFWSILSKKSFCIADDKFSEP